jgi:thioredoxin-related protein
VFLKALLRIMSGMELPMRRLALHAFAAAFLVTCVASFSAAAAKKDAKEEADGSRGKFTDNYAAAIEAAKANNKVVMLDFTGSDWCGFCMDLKKQVFDTREFKTWAGENLQLVEVDFPENKTLPDDVKKQNNKLKAQYKVNLYPTVVFILPDGKGIGRIAGYSGSKVWFNRAQEIVKDRVVGGDKAIKRRPRKTPVSRIRPC